MRLIAEALSAALEIAALATLCAAIWAVAPDAHAAFWGL